MEAVYTINQLPQGTNLPSVTRELLRGIVQRDSLSLLGVGPDDRTPAEGDESADDIPAAEPETPPAEDGADKD